MKQEKSTITLMRHGEPQGGKVFRGIRDDLLTDTGWQQMHSAMSWLNKPEVIFSSPLRRCADFAEKMAEQHQLPLYKTVALQEINFGQWEGKSVAQLIEQEKCNLTDFWRDPLANTPPGGESVRDFQHRVIVFWHELVMSQKGKNCLLVTHGGVQKLILAEVLRMPVQVIHNIEVSYGCCSTLQVYYSDKDYCITLKFHGNYPAE